MGGVLERMDKFSAKLRTEGMRPILIWVPDTRRSGLAEKCRRQSLLVKHDDAGINPLIAIGRDKHNRHIEERLSNPEPLAEDADSVTKIKYRLNPPEGKAIYAVRKRAVEPVFGIIKSVVGYRQFMRRGLKNADAEWTLVSLA
jgi:Protein  of unknown function (DUF3018)/Transposase DDE domain